MYTYQEPPYYYNHHTVTSDQMVDRLDRCGDTHIHTSLGGHTGLQCGHAALHSILRVVAQRLRFLVHAAVAIMRLRIKNPSGHRISASAWSRRGCSIVVASLREDAFVTTQTC